MKNFLKVVFLLITITILFSCSLKPSKKIEKRDFLDMAEEFTPTIINNLNDFSTFDDSNTEWIPKTGYFYFLKGDFVTFKQLEWDFQINPSEKILFYSSDDGQVYFAQDIYFSLDSKDNILYSMNNKDWFTTDSDLKEYENFRPMVDLTYVRNQRKMDYSFSWAIVEGKNPKKSKFNSSNLEIQKMEAGIILSSSDSKEPIFDFKNKILFVKKGSAINIKIDLTSNFFTVSRLNENTIFFETLEAIHVYKKGYMLSVSFDGSYWRDNIFAYKFDSDYLVSVLDANTIQMVQKSSIINHKLLKRQQEKK